MWFVVVVVVVVYPLDSLIHPKNNWGHMNKFPRLVKIELYHTCFLGPVYRQGGLP